MKNISGNFRAWPYLSRPGQRYFTAKHVEMSRVHRFPFVWPPSWIVFETRRFIGEEEPCGDTIKLNVRWLDPARLHVIITRVENIRLSSRCTAAHTDCVTLEK